MALFGKLFASSKSESLVLIDISSSSVAGAYAHYRGGELPKLIYIKRLPIEAREGEAAEASMLRALAVLGDALIKEGAPALRRETGRGSADTILVSVDAPWQETKVRTETFERATPFVFTKSMVTTALEKTTIPSAGKRLADESIIGTILNGYETNNPYGKKVHRASVIVLTSLIDDKVAGAIVEKLQGLFHTKNILSTAGNSLRYQTVRNVFPHEKNALILDDIGALLSVSLVRDGYLVAVTELADANVEKNSDQWAERVVSECTELGKLYPLPRTIFLLTHDRDSADIEKSLLAAKVGSLWLSDAPARTISVRPSHLAPFIKQVSTATPDLPLLLMTLYWHNKPKG